MQDLNHRLQPDSLQRFGVQLFADVCLVVRQLQLELKQRLVELSPALSSVNITTAGSGAQQESREHPGRHTRQKPHLAAARHGESGTHLAHVEQLLQH